MKKKDDRDWDKWFEWLVEDWLAPLAFMALIIWAIVQIARMT